MINSSMIEKVKPFTFFLPLQHLNMLKKNTTINYHNKIQKYSKKCNQCTMIIFLFLIWKKIFYRKINQYHKQF